MNEPEPNVEVSAYVNVTISFNNIFNTVVYIITNISSNALCNIIFNTFIIIGNNSFYNYNCKIRNHNDVLL
jgi:hypothetical protein